MNGKAGACMEMPTEVYGRNCTDLFFCLGLLKKEYFAE